MSLLPSPVWPPTSPPEDGSLGAATISPLEPVVAGELGTWTVTYTVGRFGVDDGGAVRVAIHQTCDLGAPQFSDRSKADYCSVRWSTPAPCRLVAHYEGELGVRPWKRTIVLRVRDQALRPGDVVTVTLGDTSGGSLGARGQTFAGPMRVQVLVDAYGTGIFLPVSAPLEVPVVAGRADHLRVHAPSDVVVGNPFRVVVVALDRWGNVVSRRREERVLVGAGVQVVSVTEADLRGESNPVRCSASGGSGDAALPRHPLADSRRASLASSLGPSRSPESRGAALARPPSLRVFWGDLHAQSEETVGSGTLDEYFTHARDHAAVDFVGHQGNDFQVTRPVWEAIMTKTQEYDAAHDFITFAGYEWSGNTPGGGDHNVHFKGGPTQRYDLHRSGHWQIHDRSDAHTDRFPVTELYREFAGRDDVILIPHVGGRYANLREFFDESLMPLVEIASCWGVFEWFADDAFRRGSVFGFSAGSDDHTARPGMSHAPRGHFSTGGGLTAVLATEKSRDAIWEAIKARRTYATTGARMLLEVEATAGRATGTMGAVLPAAQGDTLKLDVSAHGTAPLWRAEVLRWDTNGQDVVYQHAFAPPPKTTGRHRIRLGWTGSRIRARHRMTDWSGSLRVESGNARIAGASGWGFDQPEHGITHHSERKVRWASETAGDWDGIVLEVQGDETATLLFESGPSTFRFTPRDLVSRPLEIEAGGVGQRVEVELDPGPDQPRSVTFSYETPVNAPARTAYVVRITQQDGHVAWSSPIFLEVGA